MQTKNQNVVFQRLEWRLVAGRRTSNALIPIVGDEAVNAEDHTTICGEEEPAYRGSNTEYAQGERERERQKRISLYSQKCNSYNITTNLYKRLQSHFI